MVKKIIPLITSSIVLFFFISNSFADLVAYDQFRETQEILKRQAETYKSSYIRKAYTGLDIIVNDKNQIEIVGVSKGSPAEIAGIEPGDIITKVDGRTFKDRKELFKIYNTLSPGDYVRLEIQRDGKTLEIRYQLEEYYVPYDNYVMMELISKEIPIRLAVIPNDIIVKMDNPAFKKALDEHKKFIITSVTEMIEGIIVRSYAPQSKVMVIDRQHTEKMLNELKFQESGLVSEKYRMKLGDVLGATHLLIIDCTFTEDNAGQQNILMKRKLIEVKSGKVLATVIAIETKERYTAEQRDLVAYYNDELAKKIFPLEREAMEAYSSVTGSNFKDDNTLYVTLVNVVIPKYEVVVQLLSNISPQNSELKEIHRLYVEGAKFQLQGFHNTKTAIETNNSELIQQANVNLNMGRTKIEEWGNKIKELAIKQGLQLYK
jgi:membrane-associated protease RseP (regulator of RpoE activity)